MAVFRQGKFYLERVSNTRATSWTETLTMSCGWNVEDMNAKYSSSPAKPRD
jgi:hypothetical protein